MTVSGKNLSMVRGDTENISVHLRGYDLQEGDAVVFTVREDSDSDILLQKRVTAFEDNTASILIDHADTSGLEFGTYAYDIELQYGTGAIRTLIKKAKFKLEEEVTY